jgi:hypothetical protein
LQKGKVIFKFAYINQYSNGSNFKMIPLIKIPTEVFPLSEAIATKVLSYEAGRDDQGQAYQSSHKAWVQALYVPRIHQGCVGEHYHV